MSAEKQAEANALRTLPKAELNAKLQTLRLELWDWRQKAKAHAPQQPHRVRQTRRQIARVMTVLRGQHD